MDNFNSSAGPVTQTESPIVTNTPEPVIQATSPEPTFASVPRPTEDLSFLQTMDNQQTIKGFNFWVKFAAVMVYISTAFMAITIIYIPFAILYFFLGQKLWNSAKKIGSLDRVNSQAEFNAQAMSGLQSMRTYFKIMGITGIVGFVLGILFVALLLPAIISSVNNQDPTNFPGNFREPGSTIEENSPYGEDGLLK